jgi:hypothetical protein
MGEAQKFANMTTPKPLDSRWVRHVREWVAANDNRMGYSSMRNGWMAAAKDARPSYEPLPKVPPKPNPNLKDPQKRVEYRQYQAEKRELLLRLQSKYVNSAGLSFTPMRERHKKVSGKVARPRPVAKTPRGLN